jgi:hypothetical protein
MGDGMPYHLEKGALLRILEEYLNGNRQDIQAKLDVLRDSERRNSLDWILTGPGPWSDPRFARGPLNGPQTRDRILTEWFGYVRGGAGGWAPPQPPPATTGYWIGYRGDVHGIVRRALLWALELALETGSNKAGRSREPWPVELLWKCPTPWFEAWVVSRKVPKIDAGLVTLLLLTPAHRNAEVALSPIAASPDTMPPGARYPVPSWQDDYELLTFPRPLPANFPVSSPHPAPPPPARPRVLARDRDFATWVVTHRRHVPLNGDRLAGQVNTAGGQEIGDLDIPQLAEWEGADDVVVVSPSMAAGGIKHDGAV